MSSTLVRNSYGKSKVRFTKVTRHADRHDLKEVSVAVSLEGDFADTYVTGDNSKVVATDSMKNTVYALASQHPVESIEEFGKTLGAHFLERYAQVDAVRVNLVEDLWQRIWTAGHEHRHSFVSAGNEKRTTEVELTRHHTTIRSGILNLLVLKTTDSEFWGFVRDEFTTLPEARDRIFATSIEARWLFVSDKADFNTTYKTIRQSVLDVFAAHHSLSVQQTLLVMGQAAIDLCGDIVEISINMPNQHRIPFDLTRLGLENKNEILVPTDEPFGLISGTVRRD